ncbi:type II secretion system protein E [Cephaloticoccus primus]|uniref:Type II secretion system protein E n=1 Tax=Cephaloticoccus primus TaxID=1548207 RepID=A0A139SQ65_9BACT|nr:GspE/PulE family protein [Cephaloticoccus primus]KXU36677.1 type II secretion system protein E [Cephaloticoccus primus]
MQLEPASIAEPARPSLDAAAEAAEPQKLAELPGIGLADPVQVRELSMELLRLVPRELATQYGLLPLAREESGRLVVAIADPLDTSGIDTLAHLLGLEIVPKLAPRAELLAAIARHYGGSEGEHKPSDTLAGKDSATAHAAALPAPQPSPSARSEPASHSLRHRDDADDAPIIQLVHRLIEKAVEQRASDIHLEPLERRFRVRYRIDGVLIEAEPAPPKHLQAALLSRVKIMAGISIAEKRLPQDGRIQIKLEGSRGGGRGPALDLRVSTLPTSHGESIVMRILSPESLQLGLGELGFMDADRAAFERLIAAPDGIILVTGPTGSGKTTTLYSCLHAINQPDRKIITVEDPVEYQLGGVNQVPVRAEIGMSFAAALRAILRQAPNIVMIGEIRDAETAEIAIHASLTGHLVFSTLHTNDAPGAITRLIDIGIKPFLAATSLRGVLAQRLVRKICPKCAQPYSPSAHELHALDIGEADARRANFRRGRGCPQCHHTGYFGRMGIFELLLIDEPLQQLVHAGASAAQLRAHARQNGMRSLREDGRRKVLSGLTTTEEILSATLGDEA